jgi:hypothetical protein
MRSKGKEGRNSVQGGLVPGIYAFHFSENKTWIGRVNPAIKFGDGP